MIKVVFTTVQIQTEGCNTLASFVGGLSQKLMLLVLASEVASQLTQHLLQIHLEKCVIKKVNC